MMMLNTKIGGYSGISLNLIALGRTCCHIVDGGTPSFQFASLELPSVCADVTRGRTFCHITYFVQIGWAKTLH